MIWADKRLRHRLAAAALRDTRGARHALVLRPQPLMVHWRHSMERNAFGRLAYRFTAQQMRQLLHNRSVAYVATQRREDAAWLRATHPEILLQEDFRGVAWGRNSTEALRSAVFDLFALSMAREVVSSTRSSTFSRAARCLSFTP